MSSEIAPKPVQNGRVRKNRRTLKKKVRRIISIVILFIFILLAIVQSYIAYQVIMSVTFLTSEVLGRSVSATIDGEQLRYINGLSDFGSPAYRGMVTHLERMLKYFWRGDSIRFTVVKESNGLLVSIIDNKEQVFQVFPIAEGDLQRLSRPLMDDVLVKRAGPFHVTAYSPLRDHRGNLTGVFVASFSSSLLQLIFFASVVLIFVLTILGYIFSLIITRAMTMGITRPLETLAERIRMIARAEGDLSQRIAFQKTYKEVEDLADATNLVMESMENFVELLEDKQHGLEDKNRELAAQAEELEAQTEQLIALNESLEDAMRKLQDAQLQLVQSEKMASLGQLTAGVAHEINTPLGAINSNINIIEMVIEFLKADLDLEHNDKAKALVERVEKANDTNKMACDRILQIIRHLKNFARLDESDFKEADIHEGIESVLILSHNLLKHRITVHKEYGQIPLVKCFPNLMNQIVMNIIVNSAQAIPQKGDIWIKTWSNKDKVYIEIQDNGIGIPKENLRKIFDPGFTTKGVGIGTGLGLSICYKIIEKHNGTISVKSQVGKGTSFTIELPINNTFEQVKDKGID